jgi:hypothetical protein
VKHLNPFNAICGILIAVGIFAILPVRPQNPNAVAEQYRILPGVIQGTGQPKPDQQIERELNTLAAEGWKVRAANQNAMILAR